MAKLAILFAGQGAHYPGMGSDWLRPEKSQNELLRQATDAFGFDVRELFLSDSICLNETRYVQPAIVLASLLAYETWRQETGICPAAMAGFSLGEYSALAASGIFSFSETMRLLKVRSEAMQEASDKQRGGMAAVLGLPAEAVETICKAVSTADSFVVPANYNGPGQTVISGNADALLRILDPLKNAGAKRIVMLAVNGAFHSPLMASVLPVFRQALDSLNPSQPQMPVYANVTGRPYSIEEIKTLLAAQIVSPVRFEQTVRNMIAAGITHFLEIGPGSTLSGLVRKIDSTVLVTNLDKHEQLDTVKGWLTNHGFDK